MEKKVMIESINSRVLSACDCIGNHSCSHNFPDDTMYIFGA